MEMSSISLENAWKVLIYLPVNTNKHLHKKNGLSFDSPSFLSWKDYLRIPSFLISSL